MSHTQKNTCTITSYCQSLSGTNWQELVNVWMKRHDLDMFGNLITGNTPHFHVVDHIPDSTSLAWGRISLGPGSYEITNEFHAKWDVTSSLTLTSLKGSTLVAHNGNRTWSEATPPVIHVEDTGKLVSSGYNVILFRATHFVEIQNNGSDDLSFGYQHGTGNIAGLNHGSIPLYKLHVTIKKITDMDF